MKFERSGTLDSPHISKRRELLDRFDGDKGGDDVGDLSPYLDTERFQVRTTHVANDERVELTARSRCDLPAGNPIWRHRGRPAKLIEGGSGSSIEFSQVSLYGVRHRAQQEHDDRPDRKWHRASADQLDSISIANLVGVSILMISGVEASRRGWATRACPAAELESAVLDVAKRIAVLPPDNVQLNKSTVHRQMDLMGLRAALRAGTELCALGTHQKSFHEFIGKMRQGLTAALSERDAPFGDYREGERRRG